MKIIEISLALLAASLLGSSSAIADNNGSCQPLGYAVLQDGHGGSHFLYYQGSADAATSVALNTSSGGVSGPGPIREQDRPLPDNGNTRFAAGTNQHGQFNAAYIPLSSHYSQAGQ